MCGKLTPKQKQKLKVLCQTDFWDEYSYNKNKENFRKNRNDVQTVKWKWYANEMKENTEIYLDWPYAYIPQHIRSRWHS